MRCVHILYIYTYLFIYFMKKYYVEIFKLYIELRILKKISEFYLYRTYMEKNIRKWNLKKILTI